MRILFLMRNPVYVNHYQGTLRVLAERGHDVVIGSRRKRARDLIDQPLSASMERLCREYPQISLHSFPLRKDTWAPLADVARALRTYCRYVHPRYRAAHALRERAAQQVARLSGIRWLPKDRVSAAVLSAIARAVEHLVPTDPSIEKAIEAHAPDVVAITPLIDYNSYQPDYMKAAVRMGIPTVWCVASWDNLTNKGLVSTMPDRVLVWNDAQRREALELQGVPAERVVVTGAQTFDPWFTMAPSTSGDAFARQVGLPPGPFLLYVCSSSFIAPREARFVRRWLARIRKSAEPALRDCNVLIRPHPAHAGQWATAELEDPRVAVWPKGSDFPVEDESKQRYFDSLFHAAAVVGINSSGLIEAGIVGRRCFTLLAPEFARTQEGTLHFEHLISHGFLTVAASWTEHVKQLEDALGGTALVDSQRRERMLAFVRPGDPGQARTPLVADAIEAVGRLGRRPETRERIPGFVVRLLAALAKSAARRRDEQRLLEGSTESR